PAYGPQNDVTLKMPAFEWVHVQLHQQKGMISLSPPTICNSAVNDALYRYVMNTRKIHTDDTPVKVLAPGQKKAKTGRIWTYVR
ncbi:IS66 family transposase, partial [Klebsiella pneumoniae]|uniref:IS66 family transposase n=1 Tax=Klebsiella pneumoniae TaxID=573 RepID=UPI000A93946A